MIKNHLGTKEVPNSETFEIDNMGPQIESNLEERELEMEAGNNLCNLQRKDPTVGDVATNLATLILNNIS